MCLFASQAVPCTLHPPNSRLALSLHEHLCQLRVSVSLSPQSFLFTKVLFSLGLGGGWTDCELLGFFSLLQSHTQASPEHTGFVESEAEYHFVERLLPPTSVPQPPKHDSYPTPSGWRPPRGELEHGVKGGVFLHSVCLIPQGDKESSPAQRVCFPYLLFLINEIDTHACTQAGRQVA